MSKAEATLNAICDRIVASCREFRVRSGLANRDTFFQTIDAWACNGHVHPKAIVPMPWAVFAAECKRIGVDPAECCASPEEVATGVHARLYGVAIAFTEKIPTT